MMIYWHIILKGGSCYEENVWKANGFWRSICGRWIVAACYFLACKRGSKGWDGNVAHWHYNAEYGSNVSHSPLGTADTCGDKTANRVITDNGGVFEKVQEHNGEQGWINGTYCGYDDNDNSKTLSAGDTVYWSTFSENKNRRWNHYGTLEQADANHPNHS